MILILTALLLAPAQEKTSLRFRPRSGDEFSVTDRLTMELRFSDDERMKVDRSRKLSVRYDDVVGNAPGRTAIQVDESAETREKSGTKTETRNTPLAGKKVVYLADEGKISIQEPADLSEVERALAEELRVVEILAATLPPGEQAVGDTWSPGEKEMKTLKPTVLGDGKPPVFTLTALREVGGRSCAIIKVRSEGHPLNAGHLGSYRFTLQGEMTVWLDRGYVLSLSLIGALRSSREEDGKEYGSVSAELRVTPK